MGLTKEQVVAAIAARKGELAKIDVPEWGGEVFARRLTVADVEKTGLAEDRRDKATIIATVAASLTDSDGQLLFAEDASALDDVDMSVMTRIFAECLKVNGLLSKQLEEMIADFEPAQSGSSSSS